MTVSMETALGIAPTAAPIQYSFYDGAVKLFYDDAEHQYTRFDKEGNLVIIPGVTSAVHIIDKSAALTQWSANMTCDYIREKMEVEQVKHGEMCAAFGDSTDPMHIEAEMVLSWLNDARFNFQKYKNAAADTGKIAHDHVERHIKAVLRKDEEGIEFLAANMPEDVRASNGVIAALSWMDRHNVRWIFTERKIYSLKYDYAGTGDGLARIDSCGDPECCGRLDVETGQRVAVFFRDKLALIDWKTSNRLYEEYEYQTVAYLKAQTEELGYEIPLRFIIRLGKEDAQFESRLLFEDTIERDFQIFLECLALYRSVEGRKRGEREVRNAVKALLKAKKEAEIAAEKERKAAQRAEAKYRKQAGKDLYKYLRKNGVSVENAEKLVAMQFGPPPTEEEPEEIAA